MRIGASTYSREPFPKQIDEIREAGFDYAELDLTWITWEPEKLQSEAEVLAKRIPLLTAHLPPSQFHQADLARFVGFMDALAPVGTKVFNAHFLEARSAPRIAPGAKTSWLPDLRHCLDVGHAHLDQRMDGARQYLAVLGDRMALTHVHDNHGGPGEAGDEHLPFGQGTIDLARDAAALKARGYDGPATLEIFKGIPDDKKACLRKMRRWTRP